MTQSNATPGATLGFDAEWNRRTHRTMEHLAVDQQRN